MDKIDEYTSMIVKDFSDKYGSDAEMEAVKLMAKHSKEGNVSEQQKWMKIAGILNTKSFVNVI